MKQDSTEQLTKSTALPILYHPTHWILTLCFISSIHLSIHSSIISHVTGLSPITVLLLEKKNLTKDLMETSLSKTFWLSAGLLCYFLSDC